MSEPKVMSDVELLEWLAEHGTDISREELEAQYPRLLEAIERKASLGERVEGLASDGDDTVLGEPGPARQN